MKRRIRTAGILLLLLVLTGCSENDKSAQRISLEQLAETSEKSETASEMISETASETETIMETEEDMIDLTKMSGDMVYATVYI